MYEQYIRTRELLSLQPDPPVHHDELMFQVAHQVMELWLKVAVHELAGAARHLREDRPLQAAALFQRVVLILRNLEQGLSIVETMPAAHFHAFRPLLVGGSGQQSPGFNALVRSGRPTWEAVEAWLSRRGLTASQVLNDPDAYPEAGTVLTAALEVDEAFWQWRAHHLILVGRFLSFQVPSTLGRPTDYLWHTLQARLFPKLWEAVAEVAKGHPLPGMAEPAGPTPPDAT